MGYPEQLRAFLSAQTNVTPILSPEKMDSLMAKPKLWRRLMEQIYNEDPHKPFTFKPVPVMMKARAGSEARIADTYLYYPNDGQSHGILGLESFYLRPFNCSAHMSREVLWEFKRQYRHLVREFDVAIMPPANSLKKSYEKRVEDENFARYVTWGANGPVMQKKHVHDDPYFKPSTRFLVHFWGDLDLGPGQ